MSLIVVINPKGGAGKSTLSTNIAGYLAAQGHAVRLGDADPQKSSSLWLSLRPAHAHPIAEWKVDPDDLAKPPKEAGHVVLDTLAKSRHADRLDVGIVGMRVDERTLAAEQFTHFVSGLDLPLVGTLRDTQNYVHLAVSGLSVFDVHTSRTERDLAQWQPICQWLSQPI